MIETAIKIDAIERCILLEDRNSRMLLTQEYWSRRATRAEARLEGRRRRKTRATIAVLYGAVVTVIAVWGWMR